MSGTPSDVGGDVGGDVAQQGGAPGGGGNIPGNPLPAPAVPSNGILVIGMITGSEEWRGGKRGLENGTSYSY